MHCILNCILYNNILICATIYGALMIKHINRYSDKFILQDGVILEACLEIYVLVNFMTIMIY